MLEATDQTPAGPRQAGAEEREPELVLTWHLIVALPVEVVALTAPVITAELEGRFWEPSL